MLPVLTGKRKAFPSFHIAVIDPPKQHGQFIATYLEARLTCFDFWKLKRSLFKPTIPDGESITVPVQDLQLVTSSIDEQEQLTGQRIHFQNGGNNSAKSVESFSHVGVTGCDEDACVGGNADHDAPPIDLHAVTASSKSVKLGGGNSHLMRS